MRSHDWHAFPLGAPESWPESLRLSIALLLNSPQPMYIWWGPELLCFYNDAYRRSIGSERHLASLGQPARTAWAEIWHIIGPHIEQVMSGAGGVSFENAVVPITRDGRLERVYWTYTYNPILASSASRQIGGVLVICTETTQAVLSAERTASELRQLAALFEQAPIFMAVLRGPDHRFELFNPSYSRLVGHRPVIVRTGAQAFPEVAEQGFIDLLDRVYRTGEPYQATANRIAFQSPAGGDPDDAGRCIAEYETAFDRREPYRQAALGALADDREIDLVFSDVMMPGTMSVRAALRRTPA
jgi:PAS domain-containing protein